MRWIGEASPLRMAKAAGLFYFLCIALGILSLLIGGKLGMAAGLLAGLCYVGVTLLFYFLFKPVNKWLSLLAAVISLAGIAAGPLQLKAVHPLVFFGFYCLLVAYLVFNSSFLPRILSFGMAFAALGWLTFLSSPVSKFLYPYNLAPGILGEGALTLWLLIKGVNVERWWEQAGLTGRRE